jgi:tetratricopeptide (TPR) repeat protein
VLEFNPESVYSYLNLTNLFLKQNKTEEARDILLNGLKQNPSNRLLMNNLGVVYAKIEDFNNALRIWEELENIAPDEIEPYFNQAITYSKLGMIEIAISKFLKLIEMNAGDFGVFANLGNLYEKKNDFEKSIQMYNKALEIEPDNYNILAATGLVWAKTGEYGKAIEIYRDICRKDPFNIKNQMNLSMIYAIQGKYKEAVDILSEAEKIEANDPELLLNLAVNYENMEKFDVASEYYKKTIMINPNNEEPYIQYGKLLLKNRSFQEAYDLLSKAFHRIEESSAVMYLLIRACIRTQRFSEGIEFSKSLIKKNPDQYAPYELLIEIYKAKNNFSKVIIVFEEALKNINDNFDLYIAYAKELLTINDNRKALDYFLECERLNPKSQEVLFNIYNLYSKMNNQEMKSEYRKKCININPFSDWSRKCQEKE